MLNCIGPELFQISDHMNWSRNRWMLCSFENLSLVVSLAVENREAVLKICFTAGDKCGC